MRVGMIGLGLMGSTLASALLEAGHEVVGTDVDPAARDRLAARGGTAVVGVAEVAVATELVLLSLPTSGIGREVCLGPDGLAEHARPGTLVIDTTTARPTDTDVLAAELGARGLRFVDATLSGNAAQAAAGDLVVMVGGSDDDVAAARPVLAGVARSVHHLGGVGAGARAKLVVNQVLGIHRMALAEGLVAGERAGMDLTALLALLQDSAAASRAMDVWGPRMVAGDHAEPASRIRQSAKDFRLIEEAAQQLGAPSWLASTVRQLLQVGERTGLGELDNSAVVELLRRQAGIGRWPDGTAGAVDASRPPR